MRRGARVRWGWWASGLGGGVGVCGGLGRELVGCV